MTKFPHVGIPLMPTIHTGSPESMGLDTAISMSSYASSAFPSANRAYYYPFHLDAPILVTKLFWVNGATVSGNVDMGIYSAGFTKIGSSGSAAQSGTNALQAVDITDTWIGPGDFYFGIACDNTTATFFANNAGVPLLQAAGGLMQASAFALPANATPITVSNGTVIVCGLRQGGAAL